MRAYASFSAAMAASFLAFSAQADAQRAPGPPPELDVPTASDDPDADQRLVRSQLRTERGNGMLRVLPLADNVELGIGRYSVGQIARPRTHVEAERNPADIRLRDRRIAGMGLKLSF